MISDERNVLKDEFANMLISWDIDEKSAEKAFDFITDHGQKRMDCELNSKSSLVTLDSISSFFFRSSLFRIYEKVLSQ